VSLPAQIKGLLLLPEPVSLLALTKPLRSLQASKMPRLLTMRMQ